MSTRDIETVFGEAPEGRGVSLSTVSQITERLNEDLATFRRRFGNVIYQASMCCICQYDPMDDPEFANAPLKTSREQELESWPEPDAPYGGDYDGHS